MMRNIRLGLMVWILIVLLTHNLCICNATDKKIADSVGYHQMAQNIDKQWQELQRARRFEEQKNFSEARLIYEALYEHWATSSVKGMAQVGLIRVYENLGLYSQSLLLVKNMLEVNQIPETLQKYQMIKQRLLQKIEEQKKGFKIQQSFAVPTVPLSQSTNIISDFQKADYASQKKFLEKELPEETEILRLSKQAMLAEHAGKFAEAKRYYEQLLVTKEDVTAAQGDVAWPMLHCAVQRTSEVTGDEAREKEMLVWIRDNLFAEAGQYHKYLNGLMPPVQDHLKERFKKFEVE